MTTAAQLEELLREDVRREIAGYAWADVTEGIAVTVSIGLAAAPADEVERSALLAHADRRGAPIGPVSRRTRRG
jgi:GGDEF domain-containing protein